MKLLALISLLISAGLLHAQDAAKNRVPLLREGTKIIEAEGQLSRESANDPIRITINRSSGTQQDSCIVLPNKRLAEMELTNVENPESTFRVSGDVFAYGEHNYLLVREAVVLAKHAERNHPTSVPLDPASESLEVDDFDDSISDIVKDLEDATGSLVRSIRMASDKPVAKSAVLEGSKITSRRCHLVRNDAGAWIAVFVSDSTGLSDPPCTLLPSVAFGKLTSWMRTKNPSTPVLLSGEVCNYNGHGFLLVRSWRAVHESDRLDR